MIDSAREDTRISLSLGTLLRQRRVGLGLSLDNLAKLTGIPKPNIVRFESGRMVPSVEDLFLLYKPLQLDLNRMAEGVWESTVQVDTSILTLVMSLFATATPEQLEVPRTFLRLYLSNLGVDTLSC